MKEPIKYLKVRTGATLHLLSIAAKCHYVRRATGGRRKLTTVRKRKERVCDECQRQQRLARKKK